MDEKEEISWMRLLTRSEDDEAGKRCGREMMHAKSRMTKLHPGLANFLLQEAVSTYLIQSTHGEI